MNVNQLQDKNARKEWERQFNITYIEPVLNQLEVSMAKALDLVANDDQQGLHFTLYDLYTHCVHPRSRSSVLLGL